MGQVSHVWCGEVFDCEASEVREREVQIGWIPPM